MVIVYPPAGFMTGWDTEVIVGFTIWLATEGSTGTTPRDVKSFGNHSPATHSETKSQVI